MTELETLDLVRRAMGLRKRRRIGILWAEQGRFFLSESDLDPWGSRWPVSRERLLAMVEEAEGQERKPAGRETGYDPKIEHVAS